MSPMTKSVLALLIPTLLTACGSGGGGGDSASTTATPKSEITTPANEAKAEESVVSPTENDKSKAENPEAKEPKTEQPKEDNKPVQPESENPKVEEPKGELPQVGQPPVEEQPKLEESGAEKPPVAESNKEDEVAKDKQLEMNQARFKELFTNPNLVFSGTNTEYLTLSLDDQNKVNLTLLDVPNKKLSFKGDSQVQALFGNDGALLGYYGYAIVGEAEKMYDEYQDPNFKPLYMQAADDSKRGIPSGTAELKYSGKMFYHDKSQLAQNFEATVSATYFGADKKMTMDIQDNQHHWVLVPNKAQISNTNDRVDVSQSGDKLGGVSGFLLELDSTRGDRKANVNSAYTGFFSGGLYGKEGEVLIGDVQGTQNGQWQGVVGAEVNK